MCLWDVSLIRRRFFQPRTALTAVFCVLWCSRLSVLSPSVPPSCVLLCSRSLRLVPRRHLWPPARPVCGLRPGSAGPPRLRLLEAAPRRSAARQNPLLRLLPQPRAPPAAASAPAQPPAAAAAVGRHGDGEGEGPRGLAGLPGSGGEDQPHVSRHPRRRAAVHEGAFPAPHAAHAEANHRAGLVNPVSHVRVCVSGREHPRVTHV